MVSETTRRWRAPSLNGDRTRAVSGYRSHERAQFPRALLQDAADPAVRIALIGLFVLALLYTVCLAKPVLMPLAMAVLLATVLSPAVRVLGSMGMPRPFAAAVVMAAAVSVMAAGALRLTEPATAWLKRVPANVEELKYKLTGVRESVADVNKAANQVEDLTRVAPAAKLTLAPPSLAQRVVTGTPGVAAAAVAILVLAYFLLAIGDVFLRKLVGAAGRFAARRRTVLVARTVQREVTRYVVTLACVNLKLGAATAALLYLVGLPNPVLWGVLAAVLNFLPYVGPAVSCTIIAAVSVLSFDEPFRMLLGPLLFAALVFVEGQILMPLIVGRRFTLNPVVILFAMMLWGWMWGIAGALVAVPVLMILRIIGTHWRPLATVAAIIDGSTGGSIRSSSSSMRPGLPTAVPVRTRAEP